MRCDGTHRNSGDNVMVNLAKLASKWQKILRLQDWEVTIDFYRAREFSNSDALGECTFNVNSREGFIKILHPTDYDGEYNLEWIVVHELLHLHFADWTAKNNYECPVSGEQAIDSIAQALARLESNCIKLHKENKELKGRNS